MSIDIILDDRMLLLIKLGFLSTGVVNICSLLNANSDNFIDICMRCNVHSNVSRIGIKFGFEHVFSNALVVRGLLWYVTISYNIL